MQKLKEKDSYKGENKDSSSDQGRQALPLSEKLVEVFSAIGKMLKIYKAGKLPKAFKIIPSLDNWEEVVWLTQPDLWSPCATVAATKMFVGVSVKPRITQRFLNVVLLETCRDDIRSTTWGKPGTLQYHYYQVRTRWLVALVEKQC
jgi:essential nuclear protein 1